MKRCTVFLIFLSMFFFTSFAFAQHSDREKAALSVAQEWLSLIDSGNYGQSWKEAAKHFQNAVTEQSWIKSLKAARNPLGKVKSRQIKSMVYTTSLPDAPDGEYVVIQFETSFKKMKSAIETITPMIETDGKWRVSGYYIR